MPEAVSKVRAEVVVVDKTAAGLKGISSNLKGLKNELGKTTKATSNLGLSTATLVKGLVGTYGLIQGVRAVTNGLRDSIKVAGEYQMAMTGMSGTAHAFGVSHEEALQVAKNLSSNGLIPLSQSM